jgi:surface antigen
MATFKARTTAPSTASKYWKHTSAGGVNSCIHITNGSVLPNCVGYAWGRFYELLGKKPSLSRGNAELWYGYIADGYKRGKTPKLGAVICWAKGTVGNGNDGAGHVAIVEKIYEDGSILISQSGYGSKRFWTSKVKKGYALSGYKFQGFIYNPAVTETKPETKKESTKEEPKVSYFKKYTGKSISIIDGLKAVGATYTYTYRSKIAKANGIKLYVGSAKQNSTMLNLLKKGKLIKP